MTWTPDEARELYGIDRWSEGFFCIRDDGRLHVQPHGSDGPTIDLNEVVEQARTLGLPLPLLLRFSDILRNRVTGLSQAFEQAMKAEDYSGGYGVVYPIKVNQRRAVVEEILAAAPNVGLEAGSKPELLAVLALSRPRGIVICNGYKDEAYIRMALIGRRLGLRVYLVVEKLAEVRAIIRISRELGIRPWLGVRLRLSSIAHGKWQNTGGERAKFGLSAGQVLDMIEQLRAADLLDSLKLLHFHMGSQISNIRDVHLGATEACRYLGEVSRLGVNVEVMDVGGGLAVDYEGAGSRGYFSMNYRVGQYAAEIVRSVKAICGAEDLPHPTIISESGRALTAHHAVLVADVSAVEWSPQGGSDAAQREPHPILETMRHLLEQVDRRPAREIFQEALFNFAEGKEKFVHGVLGLEGRARLEELFFEICHAVRAKLRPDRRGDRAVEDELRQLLADKYFCNFSIFQSLPDIWAIDQVFPIVPLQGLDRRPERRAMLEDLTCDSDGRIDNYVEAESLESTLPVHDFDPDSPYRLGVFMVGAYQEILGDNHNLFGRTHSVNVAIDGEGYRLSDPIRGDDAATVLAEVGYDAEWLTDALKRKIGEAEDLEQGQRDTLMETVGQSLAAYTYLTTDSVEQDPDLPD
ncbi:MAG: biosynthetic arginine decarboxylase [Xanthomonadales bacterium]|nr:biosynthetic arginine decarboxylase [Xanthomonadales bacterium]